MTHTQADNYLLDDANFDRERERLDLLSKLYNPLAQEKIRALGLKSGNRCLEAGFGNGSMLVWLSDQVVPNGQVFGLDRELRFADRIDQNNIEILHGDVMTIDLTGTQVDLVYARLLLEHVSDPLKAIKTLMTAVRPGGHIFVMATDFRPFAAADPAHAQATEFNATWEKLRRRLEDTQLMDLSFGPKVPGLFEQAGLVHIEHDAIMVDATPGSDFTKEYVMAASSLAEMNADFADDCRAMVEIVTDPTFTFHYQKIHCISGRTPG